MRGGGYMEDNNSVLICGEVDDGIGSECAEHLAQRGSIADVRPDEAVSGRALNVAERVQVRGLG